MKTFNRKEQNIDEENPYWMSFADLMSALLVIFILSVIALVIEMTQQARNIEIEMAELKKSEEAKQIILIKMREDMDAGIDALKEAERVRQTILSEIKDTLEQEGIVVQIADNDTVIRIPESTLSFDSGKDSIPPLMLTNVKRIGEIIHASIVKNDRFSYLDTVFVEGHTDSRPITTGRYSEKGNWGLSADRAITVWKLWGEDLILSPSLYEVTNHDGYKLFSVSGYAATRRVELDESTPEGRAKNRRIDIRFTVKKPSIEDLEKIQSDYIEK